MENLTPSRIQPVTPEQERNTDEARPRKQPKPAQKQNKTAPLEIGADERDEKHKLDERA